MKVKELQDAVNSIEIKAEMQEEMIWNIKRRKGQKQYRMRKAAAAVMAIAAVGVAGIPVSAFVNSVIQERMEEVPQEELNAITEEMYGQEAGADGFSRAYTEQEERRMEELYQQYQTGVFPTGEVLRVDSVEEAEENEFYFLATDSVFYLPDRELTDEELLEIIDFNQKRDYALKKRYEEEFADEIAQQKEKESRQIAEAVEAGGVTEEEAVEIAKGWLNKIFGITEEGLEMRSGFVDDVLIGTENEFYEVVWYENSLTNRQYIFFINPKGSLAEVIYGGADLADGERPALEEADNLIPGLKEKAASVIEDKMQLGYEDVYCVYYIYHNKNTDKEYVGKKVDFVFVQEDGAACSVTCSWEGAFIIWQARNFESEEQIIEDAEDTIKMNERFMRNEVEVRAVFKKL